MHLRAYLTRSAVVEAPMRQKRTPETEQQRHERLKKESQRRIHAAAAEETAVDAMVKRSIEQQGP